jgi:23S rRNA (guanosine2251-2'-O)-methyltransferase
MAGVTSKAPLDDGIIEGRNAVLEALRAGVQIDKVLIAKGETDSALKAIASKAREAGAAVSEVDRRKLDSMSTTHAHQGVIAESAAVTYASLEGILEVAAQRGQPPLLMLCDGIMDPRNLGAVIRSCEAMGAHGVVIPKHQSAGTTAAVAKASSGALFHTAVARVTNLNATIAALKKSGVWIFAASADGDIAPWEADLRGPAAIVVGSEGKGVRKLVYDNCDFHVAVPMLGKLSSLNVSATAAILIYEAMRQRTR